MLRDAWQREDTLLLTAYSLLSIILSLNIWVLGLSIHSLVKVYYYTNQNQYHLHPKLENELLTFIIFTSGQVLET